MEFDGLEVKLTKSELSRSCPVNVGWAASQLANFGLDLASRSDKLKGFTTCVLVLEKAGYIVTVEDEVEPLDSPESPAGPDAAAAPGPGPAPKPEPEG